MLIVTIKTILLAVVILSVVNADGHYLTILLSVVFPSVVNADCPNCIHYAVCCNADCRGIT